MTDARFPHGFLFGTKTAAYQIEGAVDVDGRGPSIWDTFSHRPGATRNGDTGDVACDHYRRTEEDLALLARLGAPAYAFSVAWSRIQPAGRGTVNQRGLDFYRRLVDGLRHRGIAPVPTLYHWDLPQPLEDAGGWVSRDTVGRFGEFTDVVAQALGGDAGMWMTVNEPWCSSFLGYAAGEHAPGLHDIGMAVAAAHHLLLAHAEATCILRERVPGAQVGLALNLQPVRPATVSDDDRAAARRVDGNMNRLFLDPLLRGAYPADMLEHYSGARPGFGVVSDGDLARIAAPIDFLGVNFYSPRTVRAGGGPGRLGWDLRATDVNRDGVARTAMGWEIDPKALMEVLVRIRDDYGPVPLYVTENGAAFDDYVGPNGRIHDPERISYLDAHLRAVLDAISDGVDVRGYFAWSLLDNFEWAQGFSKRFGLTWVDYPTGARTPKDSFAWYSRVARSGALTPDAAP